MYYILKNQIDTKPDEGTENQSQLTIDFHVWMGEIININRP